ncbi:MAG: hypothetical protein AAB691_05000 [Patescibacteria group bacterium]
MKGKSVRETVRPPEEATLGEAGFEGPTISEAFGAKLGKRSSFVVVANAAITLEGMRVGAQVRLKHLARRGGTCEFTQKFLERALDFEAWADEELARTIRTHPAARWFTRIKGTGGERIGKVVGHIEAFGTFYRVGDLMIPQGIVREPIMVPLRTGGSEEEIPTPMIWVEGIERLTTPSKLRKYAGLLPDQKREAGHKLGFNAELRTMYWRLGGGLIKANGKYKGFYDHYRARLERRFAAEGKRIVPTPKGRFCSKCTIDVIVKAALFCPTCGEKLGLKKEPEGVLFKGHVHAMAMRRMIQLFSDHLWVVWREALQLPVMLPYPIEHMADQGHRTFISPWDMVDYDEDPKRLR